MLSPLTAAVKQSAYAASSLSACSSILTQFSRVLRLSSSLENIVIRAGRVKVFYGLSESTQNSTANIFEICSDYSITQTIKKAQKVEKVFCRFYHFSYQKLGIDKDDCQ